MIHKDQSAAVLISYALETVGSGGGKGWRVARRRAGPRGAGVVGGLLITLWPNGGAGMLYRPALRRLRGSWSQLPARARRSASDRRTRPAGRRCGVFRFKAPVQRRERRRKTGENPERRRKRTLDESGQLGRRRRKDERRRAARPGMEGKNRRSTSADLRDLGGIAGHSSPPPAQRAGS